MKKYIFLVLGMIFGYLLSRAGATTYDFYAKLFLFQDLQLLWVIVCAAAVGFVGTRIIKQFKVRSVLSQEPIALKGKPWKPTLISGSLIHGMGWGLAGACPGTVLAMLGEGKLAALFTISGIILGTLIQGLQVNRAQKNDSQFAAESK